MYDRQGREEDLGGGLCELGASPVPACAVQEQAMYIHPLPWWLADFLLHHFGDVVVEDDRVQGPALVCPGDFLSHGRQKPLRIEESRHPEYVGSCSEDPLGELATSLQEFCKPEPQCR